MKTMNLCSEWATNGFKRIICPGRHRHGRGPRGPRARSEAEERCFLTELRANSIGVCVLDIGNSTKFVSLATAGNVSAAVASSGS